MTFRNTLPLFLFFSLLTAAPVLAQDKKLSDAETFADVAEYAQQEINKLNATGIDDPVEKARALAGIFLPASEKLMEVSTNDMEKRTAYSWKLSAFLHQKEAGIEGAEQRIEALLQEIETHENPQISNFADAFRFSQFTQRVYKTLPSRANLTALNDELKTWVNNGSLPASSIAAVGRQIAERNNHPTEQFVKDFTVFVQSEDCTLPEEKKKELVVSLQNALRLSTGRDPKLYGRTLDDKNFEWDKFRNKKYVLIKFTATWCGPCQQILPEVKEAYEKYHDKGLEVVSVYVWQQEADPVAVVKESVEDKEIPWTVISEALSKKAGHPEFGPFYVITGVPTIVLVDQTGKIIMTDAYGTRLKTKLAEIFR